MQGSIAGEPLEECPLRSAEPVQGSICIRLVAIAVLLVEGGHVVGDVVVVEGIVVGDATPPQMAHRNASLLLFTECVSRLALS